MKIDCLMGTYGRHELASEALACFLAQSGAFAATLLIYNQHPVPMRLDHPRVRIVNEAGPSQSLRHIRRRMLDLADPSADLIHFWDDDDLYLPWHLQDCCSHIGDHVAWKPTSCWLSERNVTFSLHRNTFEGAWVFRADYLRAAPLDTHPSYTDHPVYRQAVAARLLATAELGGATSYIYRWANDVEHVSGYGAADGEEAQRHNIALWRSRSKDARADADLVPADLTPRWQAFLAGTKHVVSAPEWELNRKRLSL